MKVSALTVKKAYDTLEEEGFVNTVHGKGSFVASANQELMLEEKKKKWKPIWNWQSEKGKAAA